MTPPPGSRSPRQTRGRGGFTLIEIMLVLMILMFITSMVVPAVSRKFEEDQLFEAGRQVETFLRDARARAMLSGEPAIARFEKGGLSLAALPADPPPGPESGEVEITALRLAGGAEVSALPRRPAPRAGAAERDPVIRFTPSGFCEIPPLRVSRGKAWIEKRFNPLTALVDEEAFNIP